jgi:hypothetical protein
VADPIFEHAGEVRQALQAIAADRADGGAALSDPVRMTNLLKDLLPDAPRESGLLVAAAQLRLADVLREHVSQGLDTRTAAGLTASLFAANTAFSPDVCAWVTSELAIALGLSGATDLNRASGMSGATGLAAGPGPVRLPTGDPSQAPADMAAPTQLPLPPDVATRRAPEGWLPESGPAPSARGFPAAGFPATGFPAVDAETSIGQPRRRGIFRSRWALIAIGLVAMLGAAGWIVSAVMSGPALRKLTLDQFRVGDCIRGSNLGLHTNRPWPYRVEAVTCTDRHKAEVVFTGMIWPKSLAYPPVSEIISQADARCTSAFRQYVGISLSESVYNLTNIYPSKASWDSGDRSVRCLAYKPVDHGPGGAPLFESIEGARR